MSAPVSWEGKRSVATFAGRERQLAELRASLDDVIAGRSCLLLISVDRGIGKIRFAE
jgi:predicted ATPase